MSYLNAIPGVSTVSSAVEDYPRTADVFINPVVGGSGIRTKNIEAIANGCNVVTTACLQQACLSIWPAKSYLFLLTMGVIY